MIHEVVIRISIIFVLGIMTMVVTASVMTKDIKRSIYINAFIIVSSSGFCLLIIVVRIIVANMLILLLLSLSVPSSLVINRIRAIRILLVISSIPIILGCCYYQTTTIIIPIIFVCYVCVIGIATVIFAAISGMISIVSLSVTLIVALISAVILVVVVNSNNTSASIRISSVCHCFFSLLLAFSLVGMNILLLLVSCYSNVVIGILLELVFSLCCIGFLAC